MEGSSQQIDELLLPLLQAANEDECQRLLAGLLSKHAEPIIRSIIRSRLHAPYNYSSAADGGQDAQDVHAEILVQVLSRLRDLENSPVEKSIRDFRGYVAVVSYNACNRHLRQTHPLRHSLKNRLRYLLSHQQAFALWEGADRKQYCGLAAYGRQNKPLARSRLLEWGKTDIATATDRQRAGESLYSRAELVDLLADILKWAGGPIELDDLVDVVADRFGVKDETVRYEDERSDSLKTAQFSRVQIEAELDQRAYLERLWVEIQQLPVRQRAALLLNLKDGGGDDCARLFPLQGIATIRQIAETLDLPTERFAEMWNDLPLEDVVIAKLLSVTRQQVINLRKCARERLSRRMKVFEGG
jgi:hypothetical protein